jgi:two-component sensor histidine kinase
MVTARAEDGPASFGRALDPAVAAVELAGDSAVPANGASSATGARASQQIVIEVSDDGEGLPAGFSLTAATGLGLSIVQRLVTEQLKGTFQLRPGAEGGTLARVTLKAPVVS